ncbi:MAG TPA: hypothetical protein DHV36_00465 [Desulfobacteraceae bacterium]|nr:hypothetical protein [Desulfobacteraceae bacterium]
MQLLDAALAFVLTMAGLATVVTVIMESCIRVARIRKKNFVQTIRLLTRELDRDALGLDDRELWDFLVRVIKNPSESSSDRINAQCLKIPDINDRLAMLGPDKARGAGLIEQIKNFAGQLFGDGKRSAIHDCVSMEYLLRCLAETPAVKRAVLDSRDKTEVVFNRVARKYEEISAGISISFKRHAQAWSVGIGIAVALVCNINALTIFEAYLVDPDLAQSVISRYEKQLAENGLNKKGDDDPANNSVEDPWVLLARSKALGIPIGWNTGTPLAPPSHGSGVLHLFDQTRQIITWFFAVSLTGVLIGLGAPFWFDVAKRLSQIRKGLQTEAASKEFRFSAENANGSADKRREIVDRVLTEAAREAKFNVGTPA